MGREKFGRTKKGDEKKMKLDKEFREREAKALQVFQMLGATALKQVFRIGYCSGYSDAKEVTEIRMRNKEKR